MPWAIMDQAVGLPALNGCFIDGMFFVVNHLSIRLSYPKMIFPKAPFLNWGWLGGQKCKLSPSQYSHKSFPDV
jgi:hypothetical protein